MSEINSSDLEILERFDYFIETEMNESSGVSRFKVNPKYDDELHTHYYQECLYPLYDKFMSAFKLDNFEKYSQEERQGIIKQAEDFLAWAKLEENESMHTITLLMPDENGGQEPVQALFEYWEERGGYYVLADFYIGGRGTVASLAMVSFCQAKGIALFDLMCGN